MRPWYPALILACGLWAGCRSPEPEPPVDTGEPPADDDGDGFDERQDCDDDDPAVFPGAPELCNGFDDDCDGFVDDEDADLVDGELWYLDEDRDGHGTDESELQACNRPDGYVGEGGDCDDSDATINPSKQEECDGIDNDCDGEIDEDGALWAETWYQDADGDGFGDAETSREACEPGSGWVDDRTDCDDSDAGVYPDAPELQAGVDDDCDDLVDELGADDTWAVIEGESAGDRAGRALAGAGDPDGDGLVDWVVGASGDDDGGSSAGAVYLVTGDDPGQRSLSNAAAKLTGSSGSYAGHAVDGGVDLDADGWDDLLVGGPYADDSASNAGVAWIAYGPLSDGSLEDAVPLWGLYDTDLVGWSVALLGDVDGDGLGDVLVGAPYGKQGASSPGVAYLVTGAPQREITLHTSMLRLHGEADDNGAGARVAAAGDLDGDGLQDLVVGASSADIGATENGAAYIWLGASVASLSGSVSLAEADGRHHGEVRYDLAGYGLAGGGDVDGDGRDDLLVGAPYHDSAAASAGAAYLLLGPATRTGSLADAQATLLGVREGDGAGNDLDIARDADGDGLDDLLVGAPAFGVDQGTGWAALWLDLPEGTVSLGDAPWILQGDQLGDYTGFAVSGPGDMDGDGLGDLLVGASLSDSAGTEAGAVWVVF